MRAKAFALLAGALVLATAIIGAGYSAAIAVAPLPKANITLQEPETVRASTSSIAWPNAEASAFSVTGIDRVLAAEGTTEPVPIASITKVITALVILDAHPMGESDSGPSITFTSDDVRVLQRVRDRGGSWAPVVAGSTLTLRQGLQAMLLPSANNYAISLTNWAFGSQSTYLDSATHWLRRHGLYQTHVADSSGLSRHSTSTATDLVGLAKIALNSEVIRSIVGLKSVEIAPLGTLTNTNKILGVEGIDGIKTGFTNYAGHCLLFSARTVVDDHPVHIVGVVLNADSYSRLWTEVPPLVRSIASQLEYRTLISSGQQIGMATAAWGSTATVTSLDTIEAIVYGDTPATVKISQHDTIGDAVGTLTFTLGRREFTTSLVMADTLAEPDLWWRLTHPHVLGNASQSETG